jgi:hypothetical protein
MTIDLSSQPPTPAQLQSSLAQLEQQVPPTNFGLAEEMAGQRRAQQLSTTLSKEERLKKALDVYAEKCVYCTVHSPPTAYPKHQITGCPCLINSGTKDTYHQFSKMLKYHNNGGNLRICFLCHVPQYSDSLHPFTQKGTLRTGCTHYDIILPTCFVVFMSSHLKEQAQAHFEQNWVDLDSFRVWLANLKSNNVVTGYSTNAEAVFMWWFMNHSGQI